VEVQPELLAHHYSEAGCHEQAAKYWRAAGRRAAERSANAESIAHLRKGLESVRMLPGTHERTRMELEAIDSPFCVGSGIHTCSPPRCAKPESAVKNSWDWRKT
jgi:hypothetical protein